MSTAGLPGHRRAHVGVPEVVTHEEQRLPPLCRERVREAVTEVEPCWVTAAAAEVAIRLTREPSVRLREGRDTDPQHLEKSIKSPSVLGGRAAVKNGVQLDERGGGDLDRVLPEQHVDERFVARLSEEDSDEG